MAGPAGKPQGCILVNFDLYDHHHGRVGCELGEIPYWNVLAKLCSYDTILIGNFFAYPEFQKKFGQYYGGNIGWQVNGEWQTALNMGSTAGAVVGMFISSRLTQLDLGLTCLLRTRWPA